MFNDLIFSGLVCSLILVTALAALLSALAYHLYKERLTWIKRYSDVLTQFNKMEKEFLNLFLNASVVALKKPEDDELTELIQSDKPDPESFN